MKKIKFISLLVLFTAIIFSQQFADDDCVEQILEDKAAIITAEETGKNPENYPKPEIKIAAPFVRDPSLFAGLFVSVRRNNCFHPVFLACYSSEKFLQL